METDFLRCERCQTILTGEMVNTPEPVPCPGCRLPLLTRVFPAFFRSSALADAHRQEAVSSDEDASCFFHPRKKAVVDCGVCGRFLCGLCDLEIEGRHLCPTCVENSRGKGGETDKMFTREHIRYDYIAMILSVLPLVLIFAWPVTLITAPLALYYVVRYWRTPAQSLAPRGHTRQIVAGLLAFIQIAVWLFVIFNSWLGLGHAEVQSFFPIHTHYR